MKHEVKKIAKIVDEILTYFLIQFNASATLNLQRDAAGFQLSFTFTPVALKAEAFAALEKRLTGKRQPELEDYYWQLAGESEDHSELRLVAMMCDACEINLNDDTLTLKLTRRL